MPSPRKPRDQQFCECFGPLQRGKVTAIDDNLESCSRNVYVDLFAKSARRYLTIAVNDNRGRVVDRSTSRPRFRPRGRRLPLQHEIFRAGFPQHRVVRGTASMRDGGSDGSPTAETYRAFPDPQAQFSPAGVHLAATLLNDKAILHVLTLTSLSFFLCSAASTAAHQDTRSCRRSIARPRSAMVWLSPERQD